MYIKYSFELLYKIYVKFEIMVFRENYTVLVVLCCLTIG